MIKNIWVTSLRNLFRNKIYSFTILLSLGIGFTVANILAAFIVHEWNTDSFHHKKDRIYRLISEDPFGQGHRLSFISKKSKDYFSNNYPEISAATMMYVINQHGLSDPVSNRKLEDLIILAVDSAFLKIFDYPLNPGSYIDPVRPDHLVLMNKTAEKLLIQRNPIGEMVNLHTDTSKISFIVSGIIDKPIHNSHLNFDVLVLYSDFKKLWGGVSYVLLSPGVNISNFEKKINNDPNTPDMIGEGNIDYYLQDLDQVYSDVDNTRNFSKARDEIFIWISWTVIILILFLAGFNFLNLLFVSFLKRWKEFGMKKVLGASPFVFKLTALIEVSSYIVLSLILSFILILWFMPIFNDLINTSLTITYFAEINIIMISAAMIFIIAFFVILKITDYLYHERLISLISHNKRLKIRFNRAMLSLQFIISITLIVCAITMVEQMNYVKEKPLGFNKNLFELRLPSNIQVPDPSVIKAKLVGIPGVESVSTCSGNPISDNMIARYDLENGNFYTPYIYFGDDDYLQTMGFKLIRGTFPGIANTHGRLVNEAFLRYFNMEDAINKKIPGTQEDYITGIVKDFNIGSLKNKIPPAIISRSDLSSILIAKINPETITSVLPAIEDYWREIYPDRSFKYIWIDDELFLKHKDDLIFSKIIITSSLISILISCFGLFALSWGTSHERSKEIGIRKVIGATSGQIFFLLSKFYIKYILVAFIISAPIAYYLVRWWLEKFVFKIDISFSIYLIAGISIIFITLITISFQTIRSSLTDPVKELRYE